MNPNGLAKWTFSETAGELPIKLVKVTDRETLYNHWPWLEARLKVVKKKDSSHEQWTPAHVREAILGGFMGRTSAELWLGINTESVIEGFIITTVRADPFIQLPVALTAWILWANEALIKKAIPELEKIARSRYLPALEFFTTRQGWMVKAGRYGFKLKVMSFRKELG